ncbi:MAG: flagellar basal body rod protein FlgC [Alphaproteobacteria bacterium]
MVEVYSTALSGLNASSRRLQVSGNNVANAFSTVQTAPDGSLVNDPYRAQRVAQTSLEGGGVRSRTVEDPNPTVRVFDTSSPVAASDGTVEAPNVALDEEVVQQQIASYDFQANLKVIKTQKEMDQALLDIKA